MLIFPLKANKYFHKVHKKNRIIFIKKDTKEQLVGEIIAFNLKYYKVRLENGEEANFNKYDYTIKEMKFYE